MSEEIRPGAEPKRQYVTNAELKEELDKLPTRWEVRALILAAVVVSNVVPPIELARNQATAFAWGVLESFL